MFLPLAAAVIVAASSVPLAVLQVDVAGLAMIVQVRDEGTGRTLAIDCVDRCPGPPHFTELFDDTPLGLFEPFDGTPIVVAIAAAGSAYHVRAYHLSAIRITRVLDVATRAAPGFRVGGDGAIIVTTTERRSDRASPNTDRTVAWIWRGARFDRQPQ